MHRRPSRAGFTLIELLVVIAVIGMLAAILFPVFQRAKENARQTKCKANLMQLITALNEFHTDKGYYPGPPVFTDPDGPSEPQPLQYYGGFSALYPDYVTDRDLFICPDDLEAMDFAGWCRDVVYCSYNGIIDWTDSAGDGAPDNPAFVYKLYNYAGYSYCVDSGGIEDCSTCCGQSDGYDSGDPLLPQYLNPSSPDFRPAWAACLDTDGSLIPDFLEAAGLAWQHFPRLFNRGAPDYTIVTHCPHHRRYFSDPTHEMDVIVTLGGQTSLVNHSDLNNPDATGVAGWVHQNF